MGLVDLNSFLLVALLSTLWEVRTMATNGTFSGPITRVDIFNVLPGKAPFTIHCKSKDEDLGTHTVGPSQKYGFPVRVSSPSTTFSCEASWQGGRAEFDIFKAERDEPQRCRGYCRWEARRDAVVGLKYNSWEPDIVIPWK